MIVGFKEGYIQKVFLKLSKYNAGSSKVALYLITKVSNYSNIVYEVKDNLIDNKRSYNGHPNLSKLVENVNIF